SDIRRLSVMGVQLERIRSTDGLLLLASTSEERASLANSVAEARQRFAKTFADYEAGVDPGEERQLANSLRSGWDRFSTAEQGFAALVQSGQRDRAEAMLSGGIRTEGLALRGAIEKAVGFQDRQSDGVVDYAGSVGATAMAWIIILLVAMVAVCLAVGLSMTRSISAPVTAMTEAMRQLAAREMSVQIPGIGRGDEIGGMASAVGVFRDNMVAADRLSAEQEASRAGREKRAMQVDALVRGFEERVGNMVG
ncbi:MCP four helix bundle domain-containing protein, partial [Roseomonas aerophila]